MYQHLYQHFLRARPDILHCAPHSHYYWPDITRQAQLDYWDDSARYADDKWEFFFGEKIPELQRNIAGELNITKPEQVVFAANTHEFVYRIITSFKPNEPLSILTTDSEFHSFSRQSRRLLERGNVQLEIVPCAPYESFSERWRTAVAAQPWGLIFISQVFYNSGIVAPEPCFWLDAVVADDTVIVVDGYHGFCAIPTNWQPYAERVFYLGGAYKYAQGGEGMCFAVVPKRCTLRPEYTGWFADFAGLAKPQTGAVAYAEDGMRFAGATMDYTAAYRLNAVFALWRQEGLTTAIRDNYITSLQQGFLEHINSLQHPQLQLQRLLQGGCNPGDRQHGHFYTFALTTAKEVSVLAQRLREQGVATDYRHNRLRFGFALYQNTEEFQRILG